MWIASACDYYCRSSTSTCSDATASIASYSALPKAVPARERQARQTLESIPYVGTVTIDVVLSEVGDFRRFSAQRKSTAYAGLAPGVRQSDGRSKDLGITKEGSRLLRWALIQAAWRLVGHTRRWGFLYERLKQRLRAEEGHRGGRQTPVVRDGLHAQQRPEVPPVQRSAGAAVNRKHELTNSNDNQGKDANRRRATPVFGLMAASRGRPSTREWRRSSYFHFMAIRLLCGIPNRWLRVRKNNS